MEKQTKEPVKICYIPAGMQMTTSLEIAKKSKNGSSKNSPSITLSDISFQEVSDSDKPTQSSPRKDLIKDRIALHNSTIKKESNQYTISKPTQSSLRNDLIEPRTALHNSSDKPTQSSPRKDLIKDRIALHNSTIKKESNQQTISSPPTTICKNKSLPIDEFEVPININTSLNLEENNKVDIIEATPTLPSSSGKLSFRNKIIEKMRSKSIREQPIIDKIKKGKCTCADCDGFVTCSTWLQNNVTFEEIASPTKKALPLFASNNLEREITVLKTFNKIVLHGPIIPKPIFSLNETNLDGDVQKALAKMNCTSAKEIQAYMWPAIQRGLNVFMIAASKSGKTFSYLPAFCCFAMEKSGKYAALSEYEGPLIVILCSNTKNCDEICSLITTLCLGCWDTPIVDVLIDTTATESNCDILVTIPSVLEECLKMGKVKLKRLCHVAIEDGHALLKNHSQSMEKLFKIIDILQTNRPVKKSIQIVVSSEKWSVDLETLLKRMNTTPLLCFEDFLEAAIYSKVEFKRKKLKSTHKLFYLDDILKTHYMTHKSVVFCNDDEISDIKEHLEINGIECIMISNDLIEDEIFENEDMWRSLSKGHYKVFLCSDSLFDKTAHILNTNWVIHFALPSNWSQFQKRFRCLAENLCSPFDIRDSIYKAQDKCSFLLLDEACNNQMFMDFFESLTLNSIMHLHLK